MAKKNSIGDVLAATLGGNVSDSDTAGREQIEYIDIPGLYADDANFYSMDGIEELAANIELIGLQQPLRVRLRHPAQGPQSGYLVVSGHRRLAALQKLVDDGHTELWRVPCIVERDDVSPAMQELKLIYANSSTRTMSSADLAKQAERVTELLYRLKEEGFEFPGRMRDHVAEACKVSTTRIATLKVIREKLIPEWAKQWEDGKLNESAAYTLAKLPEEHQRIIADAFLNHPKPFYYWQEYPFRKYGESLAEAEKVSCSSCGGAACAQFELRSKAIMSRNSYSYNNCARCCDECGELAKCKYACPLLADKIAKLKAKAKEERNQEKEKAAAIVASQIELNAKLWKRAAEIRKAAGLSELDFMRLTDQYAWEWAVDDFSEMERGEKKLTGNSETPFEYVLSSEGAATLVAMADKLGVSLDYLLCRTDDPTPPERRPNNG